MGKIKEMGKGNYGLKIVHSDGTGSMQWYKSKARRDDMYHYRIESRKRRMSVGVLSHTIEKIDKKS